MLTAIDNPKGINLPVSKLQGFLYSSLLKKWALTEDDYNCYPLAYKNRTSNGYAAEVFHGNGTKDYDDAYLDDRVAVSSFFVQGDKVEYKAGYGTTTVALIFFVDLEKVKKDYQHRADDEVREDVLRVLGYVNYGFALQSIETGIDNVLKEFSGTRKDKALKFADMQPVHCFRVNFNLIYQHT